MDEKSVRTKISKFNQESNVSELLSLLSVTDSDLEKIISFINKFIDKGYLKSFTFLPLKVTDEYLVFINSSNEVEVIDTDTVSLRKALNHIKAYDNSNFQSETASLVLRSVLLAVSKSELKSYDVFTRFNTEVSDKNTLRQLLKDENNWIAERREIQKNLTDYFYTSVESLSRKIAHSKRIEKGLYCVRGPIASGKSSFIKSLLDQNIKDIEGFDGVLNTDAVKRRFVLNASNYTGQMLSGYVFHEEASIIGEKLLEKVKEANFIYVLDRRMQSVDDLDELLLDAERRNLPVNIFDLKVDFITSALRVLERTGVYPSDPTPDFLSLYKSYKNIEDCRLIFLEKSLASKFVKNYSTVSVNTNGDPVILNLKKNYIVNKQNLVHESEARYMSSIESLKNLILSNDKTLQITLDEHSRKGHIPRLSRNEYQEGLLRNIKCTSRTFDGELDVSASKDKHKILNTSISKNDLIKITKNNITKAFDFVYDNKNIPILSPQVLKDFIDQIARIVNQEIINDEKLIVRSGSNSHKYFYVDTKYVEKFYKSFVSQLYYKLSNPAVNPIDLAAWIEWNIDFCGHIFSDGCGRISKILSTWLLTRYNVTLPNYENGQDGFATIRESYRKRFAIKSIINLQIPTNTKSFYAFATYYKRLFEPKKTYKILASGGLIYNSAGQFLILQTSKGKDCGKWVVPGGKLDINEAPMEAFVREVFEETGLEINNIRLLGVRDYTAKSGNHYHFYDYTSSVIDEKRIKINEESLAFKWITKDQILNFTFTDSITNFIHKYFIFEYLDIYQKVVKIPDHNFDTPHLIDHTMTTSLENYIKNKLPIDLIDSNLRMIDSFEIHGIYPDLNILNELNLDFTITEVLHSSKLKKDNSNSLRPMFLLGERNSKKILICCVTPGRDLLIHYASMIKYHLRNFQISINVYAYPLAEKDIDKWTGLDEKMIIKNDIVILGYSTFFKDHFEKDSDFSVLSTYQNKFYSATRFISKNGKVINCLEANYGHWGDISDFLAQKVCQLKAQEILHVGKVGTLKSVSEVYKRIYIPKSFVIGRRNEIMSLGLKLSNSMEYIKEHSSLAHISVTTTMEETFTQREHFSKQKVHTIDIESSKIARAVALYNITNKTKIKFGAIHFSSDYLKKLEESEQNVGIDLSTNREDLKYRKQNILNEIFYIIKRHIIDNG
ncbi:MAG: NUDIX domain-containing protein [Candidatus Moranbacteria bacterium]|nr:NUDIX domain-containing protein [Candidatus Moranbacteria bacterium]